MSEETDADAGADERTTPLVSEAGLADSVVADLNVGGTAAVTRPADAGDGWAYAFPSLNRFEFHRTPDPDGLEGRALVVAAQVKSLREELLHGERSHLGVARTIRLLDRRVQEAVEELAALGRATTTGAGGSEGEATAVRELLSEIATVRSRRAEIARVREPVVEAVDKFHVHALLSGEGDVLADLIDRRTSDEMVRTDAKRFVERAIAERDDADGYHDKRVYDDLERLYETHGWTVAEAAATAAFDVPFLVETAADPARASGVDVAAMTTIPTEELGRVLRERFDAARAVAEEVPRPADATVAELAAPIRTAVAERTDRPAPTRTLADVSLPLLDVPARRATGDGAGGVDATALNHADTAVGYLLAGAFRTVGDFGGALYVTPDGEWEWAINPWVADRPVAVGIDGVDTYDRLWAHASLAFNLAAQLDADPRPRAVACSLCDRTRSGHCGPEGCAFADTVAGVNAALARLGG
jgi:hypothetical protein